ncbi:MAG: fibronectin type III domain-containing protein [Planctomycetes bacterium]|nr:fibronectin type III domain-containing protein [Planctomycetota bacterium]
MAQFPFKQVDVAGLAGSVLAGLRANPGVYPGPAVDLVEFEGEIEAYNEALAELIRLNALKEAATEKKQEAFDIMKGSLKMQLRYAENVTGFDDTKLNMLGWAGKRQRSSSVPGQVRSLRALEQGVDFVVLSWKAPSDGGRAGAYQIWRRDDRQSDIWINAGVSMATRIKLADQPRHIDMEYRVAALNKTGPGPMSNTVAVVL